MMGEGNVNIKIDIEDNGVSNQWLTSEGNHSNLWACWGLSSTYVVQELIFQILVRTSQVILIEITFNNNGNSFKPQKNC